jgi:mRNA interferase RelE/StbE
MKVEFKRSFEKDLTKLRDRALLGKVKSAIEAIEVADSLDDVANIKKLKGEEGYFRIRLGDYRIGLLLQGENICLVRILHRREFYRYFP